jgi:hypothetical protein
MSSLENDKPSATTDLHDFRDSPNPRPFGTEEDTTVPLAKPFIEQPKAFVDEVRRILGRGDAGVWLLKSQLRTGRLQFKTEEMSSKEILDFLTMILEYDPFDRELFELMVLDENSRIDLKCLSAEQSNILADKLAERNLEGMGLLEGLISQDRLPNVLIHKPEEFINFCFSRGTPGLSLFQVFVDKGKILNFDPSKFSQERAKAFADKLSEYDSLGRDFLAKLVEQGKFLPLASSEDVPACAPKVTPESTPRINPRRILVKAINKVFEREPRNQVHNRLGTMPMKEARGIWQRIANEVAVNCFDEDGHVDVVKIREWMDFLENTENFRKEPLCFIPHSEFMRSQMHRVCECLLNNRNDVRDLLNTAAGIIIGPYGQSILDTMGGLNPPVAILASLFTPYRQSDDLPTGAINSLQIAETRNHPERLIKMYIQMLTSDQFTFPSGYVVQQQLVRNGFVVVDLKDGLMKGVILENIMSEDFVKADQQKATWRKEGIEYVESTNPSEQFKLKMPIHNMNDVLFAHFFQVSSFGNRRIKDNDNNFGAMLIYTGIGEFAKMYPLETFVDGSNFLAGIAKLKEQAEIQQQLGNQYMHVGTVREVGRIIAGRICHFGTAENIDIDALLALDLNNIETEKIYPIGDRNWMGYDKSKDIPRLAIKKENGIYKFGTSRGFSFKENEVSKFLIYTTDIEVHDAEYWERYRRFA